MSSAVEKASALLQSILKRCADAGFENGGIVSREWNVEAEVMNGNEKIRVIVWFNTRGTLTPKVQGKISPFKELVEMYLYEDIPTESAFLPPDIDRWIGVDESGKGDYFGPLVTAAALVMPESRDMLKRILIRDSKDIQDAAIMTLAAKIKKICAGHFEIVVTMPERYNELIALKGFAGNSQKLLAWQHARALENLLNKFPDVRYAICDRFGNESVINNALLERGRKITVVQRTKAESDLAVAAASILARDAFIFRIKKLGEQAGCALPLGASDEAAIANAMRLIIERHGKENLRHYAKLHFKTTEKLLKRLNH